MSANQTKLVLPHDSIKEKLDEVIKKKGLVKYDVELSAGSKPGDNYGSMVFKATVNGFTENGGKTNLNFICKIPVRTQHFQKETSNEFLREIKLYEEVLFELKKLEADRNLEDGFNAYAECVAVGTSSQEEFLIMEDITKRNFSMFDRMKKLDINHAKLVMQALGKFHAYSFAMRDQKPELFKKISGELFEISMKEDMDPSTMSLMNNFLKSAVDKLKFEGIYQEKWEKFHSNYFRILIDCCKGELTEPYAAIIHGDCWNNNMMFKYEKGVPTEVCLLDWQISCYASPVLDIVYYIFSGTDKPFRDDHYQSLLHIYYEAFSNLLKQLGNDPEKLFPYLEFQNQLKKFGKYGLGMAVVLIPVMVLSGQDALTMDDMLGDSSSLTENEKTVALWTTRLADCLKDMVDFGYL